MESDLMTEAEEPDGRIRIAAFQFLETQVMLHGAVLQWSVLTKGFSYQGTTVPLLGASGIWKPAVLDLPISITTAPPAPGKPAPYEDELREDNLLMYRYRGSSPDLADNMRLREAFRLGRPLIYFLGIAKGRYQPIWPVLIREDRPNDLCVAVDINVRVLAGHDLAGMASAEGLLEKSYARRLTLQRLHQEAFRERVLKAYRQSCGVCSLKHVELLDAAHILPDGDPRSQPVVENGMSLCKIHHAAFDRQILGVRPDHVIEIRSDILKEIDGPMLRYGLQENHGQRLRLPTKASDRPNPEFLEERYALFRQAS
jgi:putative restriction endonuclease